MMRSSAMPEYQCWINMKRRCLDPNNVAYRHYGARGISVSPEWVSSFDRFYGDMGPRPSPEHSIERKNNNGNYEVGNCEWTTWTEQARNRRNTRYITFKGRQAKLAQLAEEYGLTCLDLHNRLRLGWSIERALTEPIKFHGKQASRERKAYRLAAAERQAAQ